MKPRKEIPRQAALPKRGAEFTDLINNKSVWLYRVKDSDVYVLCNTHNFELGDRYFDREIKYLKLVVKGRQAINKKASIDSPDEKLRKSELNEWFTRQIFLCPEYCENCPERLVGYSAEEARGLVAHILPKSPNSGFPSVATHAKNRIFLGTKCGCHAKFDNNDAIGRSKMFCYGIAVERFRLFEKELTEAELIKAHKYLNIK